MRLFAALILLGGGVVGGLYLLHSRQPDVVFRGPALSAAYVTEGGERVRVMLDERGRVIFTVPEGAVPAAPSQTTTAGGGEWPRIRVERRGDRRIEWIETATTKTKVVYDALGNEIYRHTWPKVACSASASAPSSESVSLPAPLAAAAKGEASAVSAKGGSPSSGTVLPAASSSAQRPLPPSTEVVVVVPPVPDAGAGARHERRNEPTGGRDSVATMSGGGEGSAGGKASGAWRLVKRHEKGSKVVEFWDRGDATIKIIKIKGRIVDRVVYPKRKRRSVEKPPRKEVAASSPAQEPPKAGGAATSTAAGGRESSAGTAGGPAVPSSEAGEERKPADGASGGAAGPAIPSPKDEKFRIISRSVSSRGRRKKVVLWYESPHYKRKVVKIGGKVVFDQFFPKRNVLMARVSAARTQRRREEPSVSSGASSGTTTITSAAAAPAAPAAPAVRCSTGRVPSTSTGAVPAPVSSPSSAVATVSTGPASTPSERGGSVASSTPSTASSAPSSVVSSSSSGVSHPVSGTAVTPPRPRFRVEWVDKDDCTIKLLLDPQGRVVFRKVFPK